MGFWLLISLAIGLGFVPAAIAERKGYSFWVWWLFGTTLFIPALIVALLIAHTPAAARREQVRAGLRRCPFCAEYIQPQARVCRFCGRDLPVAPLDPPDMGLPPRQEG